MLAEKTNPNAMADCVQMPQVFSAVRLGVGVSSFETLRSIHAASDALPSSAAAHPAKQIDSE
jgi:hypothetical protein